VEVDLVTDICTNEGTETPGQYRLLNPIFDICSSSVCGLSQLRNCIFFARKKNYSPIALRRPKRIFAAALQKSNKKPD